MIRKIQFRPGWDCISGPCTHEKKCSFNNTHGRHGDEYHHHILAKDGLTALCLLVYTDMLGPKAIHPDPKPPRGADLSLYSAFPIEKEDMRTWKPDLGVDAFSTAAWTSALAGGEFWQAHGAGEDPSRPSETYWKALEERFVELDAIVREERVDTKWKQCPHCKGEGVLEL